MGTYEFRLPDIGEGIAEAEIVAWHAHPGEYLEEDQPLVDMMTDKATVEMTAPVSGHLSAIAGAIGQMVSIGATLAIFAVDDDDVEPRLEPICETAPVTTITPTTVPSMDLHKSRHQGVTVATLPSEARAKEGRVLASPSVRKRAQELGIVLADIKHVGSRIRHGDLDAFLMYNRSFGPATEPRKDQLVPVVGLRRRIANNMTASKAKIPHFSYIEEIDVTRLEVMRAELNAARSDGIRLSILPFLITAICKAVPEFPMMNARYDDEAGVVTRHGAVHCGIATQTPQGLLVPVVRHAEALNIWQLSSEIGRLAEGARTGKALSEELSGSTITVTSLGTLGGIATTPVINRPEVAILGPNRIVDRIALINGEIAFVKLMNLSISCDHRVVDGWDAASFVQAVKRLVESPSLLFAP